MARPPVDTTRAVAARTASSSSGPGPRPCAARWASSAAGVGQGVGAWRQSRLRVEGQLCAPSSRKQVRDDAEHRGVGLGRGDPVVGLPLLEGLTDRTSSSGTNRPSKASRTVEEAPMAARASGGEGLHRRRWPGPGRGRTPRRRRAGRRRRRGRPGPTTSPTGPRRRPGSRRAPGGRRPPAGRAGAGRRRPPRPAPGRRTGRQVPSRSAVVGRGGQHPHRRVVLDPHEEGDPAGAGEDLVDLTRPPTAGDVGQAVQARRAPASAQMRAGDDVGLVGGLGRGRQRPPPPGGPRRRGPRRRDCRVPRGGPRRTSLRRRSVGAAGRMR